MSSAGAGAGAGEATRYVARRTTPYTSLEEYRTPGRADGPMKCTWFPGTTEKSPHRHFRPVRPKILDTALQAIGDTPLVRLGKIGAGLKCEILAKCEFFNAGGSVKDRIGRRMIEEAEASGRIKPGDTIIEPTSGNTGIGLALACAIKGYRMIVTMPEKMSQEKVDVLKALGAEIIRTPNEAAFDSPESHIGVAKRLLTEIPNSHILDQYCNTNNPLAHYDGTAEEILEACEGKLDMIVVGAGTGGTIAGTARKLKEKIPHLIVVGTDPHGSILAEPEALNHRLEGYQVEGVGYDFIPDVLDRDIVDVWFKTEDKPAFNMSRRLIREEGLLCGGSSGANVYAALEAAATLGEGQRCVVMLPDGVRNYMTKFLSPDWMERYHFTDPPAPVASDPRPWAHDTVGSIRLATPFTVLPSVTCKEAVDILKGEGFDQLPIVSAENEVLGVVTEGNLTAKLMSGRVKPTDPVTQVAYKQFRKVAPDTSLSDLARMFDSDHFALVITSQRCYGGAGSPPTEKSVIAGVVSRIDLLAHVTSRASRPASPSTTPRAL